MNRREKGAIGETIAADYLAKRGYKIRERNYRTRESEIDIIAEKDGTLVFFEVRAKTGKAFGSAEAHLSDCGEQPSSCRIDLIAIKLGANGELIRLALIENATGWTTT